MDSLYLFGSSIRVSQALAIVLFVICTASLVYFAIKKPNKPFYHMQGAAAAENSAAEISTVEQVAAIQVEENTEVDVVEDEDAAGDVEVSLEDNVSESENTPSEETDEDIKIVDCSDDSDTESATDTTNTDNIEK